MDSALSLSMGSSSLFHFKSTLSPTTLKPTTTLNPPSNLLFTFPKSSKNCSFRPHLRVRASSSNSNPNASSSPLNPLIHNLKTTAGAIVFAAAMVGKFQHLPARAEPSPSLAPEVEIQQDEKPDDSPLSQFLESNSDAVGSLKDLLQQKLKDGEDEESLKVLKKLVSAQPDQTEWKFLMARLLNEMGETQGARNVFEEILSKNPLSFEALFENALLMDRCGEGEAVIERLEEALKIAQEEGKAKEARDVRLIMAQIHFLQKNVEEALTSYHELTKEDPNDFRPYFCKGMIYSLLDRNNEAREQFAKYRELSPKKFEVEGYLRSPLSRMKLFGTDEKN